MGIVLFKLSRLGWVQQLGAPKGPRARETERRGRLNLELTVRGARQMGHGRGWKRPRRVEWGLITNNKINNNSSSTSWLPACQEPYSELGPKGCTYRSSLSPFYRCRN